eukprot:Partr_v1_DN28554_c1_g1_i2_m72978 putative DEAH (Asp-Glu-Ala-His) box polypeptide
MSLPIHLIKDELLAAISAHHIIAVVGETGSGKTTQLPQWLLADYKRVAITQPRRVAAVTVSERVSEELAMSDPALAKDVCGYKVRFADRTTASSRLIFMTDGVLLRLLQTDAVLRDFDVVILDEAHERSMETDILFGLLRVVHQKRPDLRIIVMSATLDSQKFSAFFGDCPVVEIPGRHFDVDIHHLRTGMSKESEFVNKSIETALHIHRTEEAGDILVFLTGQSEIEYACRAMEDIDEEIDYDTMADGNVRGMAILPLYGSLDSSEQKRVFYPARSSLIRKIVFATNIAATSVTIPNIKYVVDAGYVKQKEFDPQLDMDALVITKISQSAADQRAGRAGRTLHGKCWRLYSVDDYNGFPRDTTPEIQRTSLTNTVLTLKKVGIRNIIDFPFMDPPDKTALLNAGRHLYLLDALTDNGELTKNGDIMSLFPMSAALSRALIASCQKEYHCSREMAAICAALSTEDFFYRPRGDDRARDADDVHDTWKRSSGDHMTILNVVEGFRYAAQRSTSEAREFCKHNYFRYKVLNTILDIEQQLFEVMTKCGLPILSARPNRPEFTKLSLHQLQKTTQFTDDIPSKPILQALLHGFFMNLAKRHQARPVFYHYAATLRHETTTSSAASYLGLTINQSSVLAQEDQVSWVCYHEITYTRQANMRVVSKVILEWAPQHLLDRLKSDAVDEEALVGDVRKKEGLKKIKEEARDNAGDNVDSIADNLKRSVSETEVDDARARYLARKKLKG